jgi:hypothetical protein
VEDPIGAKNDRSPDLVEEASEISDEQMSESMTLLVIDFRAKMYKLTLPVSAMTSIVSHSRVAYLSESKLLH